MKKLYVIKDGVKNNGCIVDKNGNQVKNTNYYLISFGKGNEGYIEKKSVRNWQLYTQVGEIKTIREMNNKGIKDKSRVRYYHFPTFENCVDKLKELSDNCTIEICDSESFPLLHDESKNKMK